MESTVFKACEAAHAAAGYAALLSSEDKNRMLELICEALKANAETILCANREDITAAEQAGKAKHFIDRLALNPSRIEGIAEGVAKLSKLPDPVGRVLEQWTAGNGLEITKVSVPLGVVGIVYEARPNVTVDAMALCLKSGNAVVLRGSSETVVTNREIVRVIKRALSEAGFGTDFIQLIEDTSREGVGEMMRLNRFLDVLIPRGSGGLIRTVVENSTVPVIQTGEGNCHVYVERSADLQMAVSVLVNAKVSRPSVCNAAESLLVDEAIAEKFLPMAVAALARHNVKILGCERTCAILKEAQPATEEDYFKEFNDYILAVRLVSGVEEAVAHVNRYGTRHSETILTTDEAAAQRFLNEVDAACVYVNASTRFTDGFEFGFGAEMGISTQKLHARGPMGLKELTTYKYTVRGTGQVRG